MTRILQCRLGIGQVVWTPPAVREAAAVARREADTLTLADDAQTWIKHRDLKPRTRIAYTAALANHIAPALEETRRSASCPPRRCVLARAIWSPRG